MIENLNESFSKKIKENLNQKTNIDNKKNSDKIKEEKKIKYNDILDDIFSALNKKHSKNGEKNLENNNNPKKDIFDKIDTNKIIEENFALSIKKEINKNVSIFSILLLNNYKILKDN